MTRNDLLTLAQRLREYNHNPHHINPTSEAFHKLIDEAASALSILATPPANAADMGGQAGKEVGEPMQVFACQGKGGEYVKLGYAKPAGAIKAIQGDSGLMVYMDTATKQLYFRDPTDFRQRMSPLGTVEPCSLGGDLIRQMTLADILAQHRQQAGKLVEALDHIGGLTRALRHGGPDPMDLQDLSDALEEATSTAHEALADWEKTNA